MRRIFFILVLVGVVVIGWNSLSTREKPALLGVVQQVSSTPTPTPILSFGTPVKLEISSITVSGEVEKVGLDDKGAMDVPKDYQDIGWYELGFKPGEKGSAVLAGHVDTPQGKPGIFWDLKKVKKGDIVSVFDSENQKLDYQVTRMETYKKDDVPLQEIFADTSSHKLNLITCEGTFDKSKKTYSDRLVVYTELVMPE